MFVVEAGEASSATAEVATGTMITGSLSSFVTPYGVIKVLFHDYAQNSVEKVTDSYLFFIFSK